MKDLIIREAEPKDLREIVILCKEHADYEQADYRSEMKETELEKHLFNDQPSVKCLVVEQNKGLVGYATLVKQFSTWDANFYMYLDCLYLQKSQRGKGIGKILMLKIKEQAKKSGCIQIQWQTPEFNTSAIGFYNHLGASSKSKERFIWNIE